MSRVHKLVRLLNRLISERPDEVRRGVDRFGRTLDRKTGGRYSSKIQQGTRMASRYIEGRGHKGHKRHW